MLAALAQARQGATGGPRQRAEPTHADLFIGGWVECVEGRRVGCVYTEYARNPGAMPSLDQARAYLHKLRDSHEALHGGEWIVVCPLHRRATLDEFRAAERAGHKRRMELIPVRKPASGNRFRPPIVPDE